MLFIHLIRTRSLGAYPKLTPRDDALATAKYRSLTYPWTASNCRPEANAGRGGIQPYHWVEVVSES